MGSPLESRPGVLSGSIFRPHVFGEAECRPRFRPSRIEPYVRDDLGDLRAGNTVILRGLKMECQRAVRDTLADERCDRNQAAVTQAEFVGAAPHLAEKDIVVEFREFRGELPQLVAPCRLYDLFLCHNVEC